MSGIVVNTLIHEDASFSVDTYPIPRCYFIVLSSLSTMHTGVFQIVERRGNLGL